MPQNIPNPAPLMNSMVIIGLLAIASTQSYAQSEQEIANTFHGTWRLVSWTQRLSDGRTRQAPNSVGYIIYTDTGHMCYVGMNPNRPRWKSSAPTETEALSGIVGLGAYCGTVEVHASEGFVLHRVEIERVPNNVGMVRKRWFNFDGKDRVTLKVDTPELIAPVIESVLTWERVPSSP
jgi:hypothetical protein